MFKCDIKIAPQSALRPRYVTKFKRVLIPKKYRDYKDQMIAEFNQYADDEDLIDVMQNAAFGISLGIIFRFDNRGSRRPFYRKKPDLDNLLKATVDALFESKVNLKMVGYDEGGYPIYKQIVDDSNIVQVTMLKKQVSADEVGQSITIKKIVEEGF